MSEEKKIKWLHEFEVNKTVKKEISEDGKDAVSYTHLRAHET